MVTLGNGVTASVQDEISSLGASNFIVFPVRTTRGTIRPFDEADVRAVEQQIAGVKIAAGGAGTSATAFYNGQDWDTRIEGGTNPLLEAQTIAIKEGRAFTRDEEAAGKSVCLLGLKVREAIFPRGSSPVGARMRLGNVSCQVIGVMEERGQGGGADDDDVVYMPLKTVQRRFRGNDNLDFFVVKYDSAYAAADYATAEEFYSIAADAFTNDLLLGRARIGQAFAKFYQGDPEQGLAQLRAIAADNMLPAAIRAEAAYHLAIEADVAKDTAGFESYASQVNSSASVGQWQQRMQIYQQQR